MLVALRANKEYDKVHYTSPHTSYIDGKLDQTTQHAQVYDSLVTGCPRVWGLTDLASQYDMFVHIVRLFAL